MRNAQIVMKVVVNFVLPSRKKFLRGFAGGHALTQLRAMQVRCW